MKKWKVALGLTLVGLALVAAGCKGKEKAKPKEVSVAARAEAAQNFSEAEFATQIRDHARAEGLLAHAVELDPDVPNYWLQLGASRKKQGNVEGARKAYEHTRELLHQLYEQDKKSVAPLFAEMEICVLLGKPNDAKRLFDQALKEHPDDPEVKNFVNNKTLDAMLVAPSLKEMAL